MRDMILQHCYRYFLSFMHTQVFLTLVSMPVLLSWGLPISWMTFIGNFIFAPVLTLVIGLSSLLFFTELFHIPNQYIALCFDYCITAWYWILQKGSASWLIEQANPGFVWLACIPIVTLIGLLHPCCKIIHKTILRQLMWMLTILCTSYSLLIFKQEAMQPIIAEQIFHPSLHITQSPDKGLYIEDFGYLNTLANPENAIRFKLKPYLVSTYGTSSIKNLTLCSTNIRSLKGALAIVTQCNTTELTIPYFDTLQPYAWKVFFKLKELCKQKKYTLIRTK